MNKDQIKHFIVAETIVSGQSMFNALLELGLTTNEAADYQRNCLDYGATGLSAFAGRLCYKSFKPGLNKNVTKIREDDYEYIGNVLKQAHGSVFEHASTSVLFTNVSRIFTHELVRHRAGCAYSQESQRFVRLDDFQVYIPDLTPSLVELAKIVSPGGSAEDNQIWAQDQALKYMNAVDDVSAQTRYTMAKLLNDMDIDAEGVPFHIKKQITSALRRFVPGGVATNILVTANHRAWRHIFEMRTAEGAEEEIRWVMSNLASDFFYRYRSIYQDMSFGGEGGLTVKFANSKI